MRSKKAKKAQMNYVTEYNKNNYKKVVIYLRPGRDDDILQMLQYERDHHGSVSELVRHYLDLAASCSKESSFYNF